MRLSCTVIKIVICRKSQIFVFDPVRFSPISLASEN